MIVHVLHDVERLVERLKYEQMHHNCCQKSGCKQREQLQIGSICSVIIRLIKWFKDIQSGINPLSHEQIQTYSETNLKYQDNVTAHDEICLFFRCYLKLTSISLKQAQYSIGEYIII